MKGKLYLSGNLMINRDIGGTNMSDQTHLSVKNDAGYPTIQLEGNNE